MSLQHHPKPGAIVMAEFPADYLHGEMEKRRPAIVVRKAKRGHQKCATLVPISMTAPRVREAHHVIVPTSSMPKGLRDRAGDRFAKCDCVNTLSLERMDLVAGPRVNGRRQYEAGQVSPALLLALRKAVAGVIGVHAKTFAPIEQASSAALARTLPQAVVTRIAEHVADQSNDGVSDVDNHHTPT